ncbi:hypothetical protein BGZ94_004651 [Podila epigama]|nr:hypothetical protein BGZ94_004651 [Podila epigama]
MSQHGLALLEDSTQRLNAIGFEAPRFYSALMLENAAVPIRDAKRFERRLFNTGADETFRSINPDAKDFEGCIESANKLNEICQNEAAQVRLREVEEAHEDVLASIAAFQASIAQASLYEEANRSMDDEGQELGDRSIDQTDEALAQDIEREEGEIFALEQILSEKQDLLTQVQRELDALEDITASFENMERDVDPEEDTNNTAQLMELEYLEEKVNEATRQEQEQLAVLEQLSRERDELMRQEQTEQGHAEQDSSPVFDDIVNLWRRITSQEHGDVVITPKGFKEVQMKLEPLLYNFERAQHDIVHLDVLQQISSTLIDTCADMETPEFDPPQPTTVKLAARTLQILSEAGGSVSLEELKARVGLEAVSRGETEALGVQAVYGLVACHLIHINRDSRPNLVSFT